MTLKIASQLKGNLPQSADLMVHSSLKSLGIRIDAEELLHEIMRMMGGISESTLLIPTFTFNYTKTGCFNVRTSLSESGQLSEIFRHVYFENSKPERTINPMQSVCVIGKNKKKYILGDNACQTSFGSGSIYDQLLKNDAYCMLLGVDFNKCTFYHFLEEKFLVPYRFWKEFKGCLEKDGKKEPIVFRYFARDLEYENNINHYGLLLEERGLVHKFNLFNSVVRIFKYRHLYDLLAEEIQRDPWCLTNTIEKVWQINTTTYCGSKKE